MLNTDQHNIKVKKRMTCEEFIKNNQGIDDGKSLSNDFLSSIFEEIKSNEIKLDQKGDCKAKAFGSAYLDYDNCPKKWITATHHVHVKTILKSFWTQYLISLSHDLKKAERMDTTILGLDGFKFCLELCCLFNLELEKKAFLTSLSNFGQFKNIFDVRDVDLGVAKILLDIGSTLGDDLDEHWEIIIKMISKIEEIHVIGMIEPEPKLYLSNIGFLQP
jgi:brefeldin A-inhibited guanine nucleotide-exchange protein